MSKHIFSIQINKKHVLNGIAHPAECNTLMTSAVHAEKIRKLISPHKKMFNVKVCSEGLTTYDKCASILGVGINRGFSLSYKEIYNTENSALIKVNFFN